MAKMSNPIIGVLLIVLISMSTWFWYDHSSLVKQLSESNTSGAKGQNQATDDLFAKKEHCASLRSKVEDDAKSESFGQNIKAVYQVFYSPSLNTCLSATYSIYGGTPSDELLSIDDVLTGRNVWQQYLKPSVKFPVAYAQIDAEIQTIQ
jgi:hypothetical protein